MRRAIRVRHYSLRTEEAYLAWIRRFFAFTRRHPKELSANEINAFFTHLEGTVQLIVLLLYGTGMRILECLRLRVQDVDFDLGHITIRDGIGREPHLPPLLRDPPAHGRLRHPHHPGAPRPQGRQDHNDLHPHPEHVRRPRDHQPRRHLHRVGPSEIQANPGEVRP
jgi:integrase